MENSMYQMVNVGGRLLDLSAPVVMGIVNATPDSFYAGNRFEDGSALAARARQVVAEGAAIVDVGACSTRPGACPVSEDEEMRRLSGALRVVRDTLPDAILSVDTYRPSVAAMAVRDYGVAMVNDVSEGTGTPDIPPLTDDCNPMFETVARLGVAYVLTSVRPDLGQTLMAFARKVSLLRSMGVRDVVLDPGFGFGKTLDDNYALLARMECLGEMQLPLLVGVSRKSMAYRLLDCTPSEALNATSALHAIALSKGASILRVHDVKEAVEVCRVVERMKQSQQSTHIPLQKCY